MFKNGKIVRGVVLASILASTSLAALSPITAEAQVDLQVVDPTTIESGIEYLDVNGYTQKLEIPSNVAVQLNANAKRIIVKFNGQTKYLDNVKNVTIKNITVSNAVAFHYLTSAETVTFDNVKFQRGVDFGGLKNVKALNINNTEFGEYCGYSLAVHDAPKLTALNINGAMMKSDFRVYFNKSLKVANVVDSQIDGHAKQHTNAKGYVTNYDETTFKRSGALKKVYTDGPNLNSAFNINLSKNGELMGQSKFDASKEGKIFYTKANGQEDEIVVPGHVYIKFIDDTSDRIRVKLSDNRQFYIDNPRELTFRNVEFRAPMEFTHRNLRLEKLEIVNSKIWNVQVWNSETLKSLKVSGSETGHACALVKAYNNKVQDTFSIQDSKVVDVKAMNLPNVKGNSDETGFSLYSTYTHGYVYTANIGTRDYELPVYSTRFDNYIASTNTINGTAERKIVGYKPVFTGDDAIIIGKNEDLTAQTIAGFANLKVLDKEDGDITNSIVSITDLSTIDNSRIGDYDIELMVTDSDGNVALKTVHLTIV